MKERALSEDEAIFTPLDFVRYVAENRKVSVDTIKVPQRLLITYQRRTYEYGKKLIDGTPLTGGCMAKANHFALDNSTMWKLDSADSG